jgi:hypothetical protein
MVTVPLPKGPDKVADTTPDAEPTVANVEEDDHIPPGVVLLNVVVAPWHTTAAPVIVAGSGFIVVTIAL